MPDEHHRTPRNLPTHLWLGFKWDFGLMNFLSESIPSIPQIISPALRYCLCVALLMYPHGWMTLGDT